MPTLAEARPGGKRGRPGPSAAHRGVGEAALAEDARERAAGMQVVTARGVESESQLPSPLRSGPGDTLPAW